MPLARLVQSLALLLATLPLLSACSGSDAPATDTIRPVKLFAVADPLAQHLREFPGRLKAPEEAELSFRLGGELKELRVREGQLLQPGEAIAELDDTDVRLRLNDRQASYDLTRSQLERMQQLIERQMVSQAELDERRAQFNQAEAALNLARQELAYTRLSAPFAGRVARTHVERFQIVQPNQPIVTLYAGDSMDVVFQVPESLLSGLRADIDPGDIRPRVRIDSLPGIEIEALYKEHASQPDPKSLTYQVTLAMQPPQGLVLLPGMSATVLLDVAQVSQQAGMPLLVPVEAVFSPDAGGPEVRQVWIVSEHEGGLKVHAREVQVGQLTQNAIEILAGLEPGEQIVAAGGAELAEGQRVREWTRERGL